jgi:hypothetical protein
VLPELGFQDSTAWIKQPGQDREEKREKDSQNRTGSMGKPEWESQNGTCGNGKNGQDRTTKTGLSGWGGQLKTTRIRQPVRNRKEGTSEMKC